MSEIGTPAELRLGQKPGPLSLRGLGWTGQRPVPTQLLLGFGFLLVAVGGFDGRTDAGQDLLGWLSKGTVGLQFQILVESFGGALGCDHLVALQGCFANHVHTQPVVRVRLVGIGIDDLLEAVDRIINFARVGLYGTLVEIEHGGARRIELGSLIIGLDGVIELAGACHGLGHGDRMSTRLNSSHITISYAVFCLKKKKNENSRRSVVEPARAAKFPRENCESVTDIHFRVSTEDSLSFEPMEVC